MRAVVFWCLLAAGLALFVVFCELATTGTFSPLKALQFLGLAWYFGFGAAEKFGGYRDERRVTVHGLSRAGGWLIVASVVGYVAEWWMMD